MTAKLSVIDLFAGIAGFTYGLERAGGFRTVGFVERDPFCQRVLAARYPGVPIHDDVTTRVYHKGEADVITAGFPCQDISFAGTGAGLAGSRSGLWREVVRAVRVVGPLYVLLENVAALLNRGMGTVLGDLAESGYDADWDCIPGAALRAPHIRDRAWILAHSNGGRRGADASRGHDADRAHTRRTKADGVPGAVSEQRHSGQVAASPDADDLRGLQPGWCFKHVRRWIDDGVAASPEWETPWPEILSQIQGMDDGLSDRLDKAGIDATGNTIIPQIPELIGRAILEAA